jgi:trk system potassium uptake protein TrkH
MAGLGMLDKFHNAVFHSISTRTAGFNAVDPSLLQPATIFFAIFLMFIGGSPGGTAGGIKTTTFMILMYTVLSVGRGYGRVQAFSRYIPQKTIYRATTVTIGGLITGFIGLLALLTTQRLGAMEALFEVVSALGTVGMSLGATAKLDQIGKVVVMLLMFLGRVGPLSVVLFLGKKSEPTLQWKLSKEDVSVA